MEIRKSAARARVSSSANIKNFDSPLILIAFFHFINLWKISWKDASDSEEPKALNISARPRLPADTERENSTNDARATAATQNLARARDNYALSVGLSHE